MNSTAQAVVLWLLHVRARALGMLELGLLIPWPQGPPAKLALSSLSFGT
jgi:hypothetical protein